MWEERTVEEPHHRSSLQILVVTHLESSAKSLFSVLDMLQNAFKTRKMRKK